MRLESAQIRILWLAIVCLVISVAPAQAQVKLRYKFGKGDNINYVMTQNMSMTMSVQNMNIETKMNQVVEMTWAVQDVDDDGTAKVQQTFTAVRFVMDAQTGKIEFDSKTGKTPDGQVGKVLTPLFKAMVGAKFLITMDTLGNIKDVEISNSFLKEMKKFPAANGFGGMFTKEGFKQMMSRSGLVLPEKAIEKDAVWSNKMETKSPIGTMIVTTKNTYLGSKRSTEEIAMAPKIPLNPDPNSPVSGKILSQKVSGTALFDNAKGQIASVQMQQNMEMELTAGGMIIGQILEQTVSLERK